jgi:hypothetical protein
MQFGIFHLRTEEYKTIILTAVLYECKTGRSTHGGCLREYSELGGMKS